MKFFKKIYDSCKTHIKYFTKGLKSAFTWTKTENTIINSAKIRHKLKEITLLNGCLLTLTIFSNCIIFPILESLIGKGVEYTLFEWTYWISWAMPMSLISGALNMFYCGEIVTALPLRPKPQEREGFVKALNMASSKVYRVLLIPGLFLQGYLTRLIPVVGPPAHFLTTSWLISFYQFEYHWDASRWQIDRQIGFFEKNWAFFLGFGLPLNITTYFIAPPYATPLLATMMPLYIIMASHASMQRDFNHLHCSESDLLLSRLPVFTPISKICIHALYVAKLLNIKKYSPKLFNRQDELLEFTQMSPPPSPGNPQRTALFKPNMLNYTSIKQEDGENDETSLPSESTSPKFLPQYKLSAEKNPASSLVTAKLNNIKSASKSRQHDSL